MTFVKNIEFQYVSILRPPSQPSDDLDFKTEWKQVVDIMWSDPVTTDSISPTPNKRGAGEWSVWLIAGLTLS